MRREQNVILPPLFLHVAWGVILKVINAVKESDLGNWFCGYKSAGCWNEYFLLFNDGAAVNVVVKLYWLDLAYKNSSFLSERLYDTTPSPKRRWWKMLS